MTTEQLTDYLTDGGTDMQYVLEWVLEHSSDKAARMFVTKLFDNIEEE